MTPDRTGHGRTMLIATALILAFSSRGLGRDDATSATPSPGSHPPLSDYFGFGPMEIYKFEDGVSRPVAADLNADGLNDLLVVNNRRSKIELLYQRKPGEPLTESTENADNVNDLPDATRFRRDSVSSVWRIANIDVGDVTGDGKPDIVFFGDPKELVIIANAGDGKWEAPHAIRNSEGTFFNTGLSIGDINSDARKDVVLLGENHLFVYLQESDGSLSRPIRYSHSGADTRAFMLNDIDGDGRTDIITFGTDGRYPISFRLQDTAGKLGPEQRLRLPAIRSLTPASILGRKAADLFVIQQVSNRVVDYSLDSKVAAKGKEDWLGLTYAYPVPGEAKSRPTVVADVDGDGLADLVTADPKTAQLVWFQQRDQLGLSHGETFPGLLQVTSIEAADLDGDGKSEIVLLSKEEKSIGLSKFDKGRLSFPQSLSIDGDPVAMTAGKCLKDQEHTLVYVTKVKGEDDKYELKMQKLDAAGSKSPHVQFDFPKLKDTPSALRLADVNQDGRVDVLVFVPYEALTTMIQNEDGKFTALSANDGAGLGLVKEANPAGICVADVTGDGKPEVLLAQKSFARALKVVDGRWTVVDQYNASGSDANVIGVAALFEDKDVYPKIILYNKDKNELQTLIRREDGTYAEKSSQPIGAFDLSLMTVAPLAGDKWPTVMLADGNRFSLYCPNRLPYRLVERSQFETKLKDSRFNDTVVGDLNHDGRPDIVVSDTAENFVHILTFDENNQLTFALKFRVFETKQYQRGRGGAEPREMVIADVTGDGHDDLMLICHDRMLLYPAQ